MPGEACRECTYFLGHRKGCTLTPKTEREQGWNEAIEAAAKRLSDLRDGAKAAVSAMETPIMQEKWHGIADALDDAARTSALSRSSTRAEHQRRERGSGATSGLSFVRGKGGTGVPD